MSRSIFIVGIEGNMGRRYAAIAKYLGIDCSGCDIHSSRVERMAPKDALVIIATPTPCHLADCLKYLSTNENDVLCEKPIVKSEQALKTLAELNLDRLYMVNNYCFAETIDRSGKITFYDYYNSGKDGLAWDCIQLIGLAKNEIELYNKRPFWTCIINGAEIDRNSIDRSYVKMIFNLMNEKINVWSGQKIIEVHQKVLNYIG
ncbi:MAG: Gfo/Idh/MocA family oxidoreductase [Candidatus Methylopumilus sp.]|nr:Gfo/Idh/MocA family oxidoreductase [Candidatus Methylopumilus sp.]